MNSSTPSVTSLDSSLFSTPPPSARDNKNISTTSLDATPNSSSNGNTFYESALDSVSVASSTNIVFEAPDNSMTDSSTDINSSSDLDATLSGSTPLNSPSDIISNNINNSNSNGIYFNSGANASKLLIQSESTDTNTSQDEVDPKSQLANKTIFKTDNPNLSIIEISGNSIKDQDIENSVVVIGTSSDEENDDVSSKKLTKQLSTTSVISAAIKDTASTPEASDNSDKRRKKPESLIHSSKQKLNVAIAEASAAESKSKIEDVDDTAKITNGADVQLSDLVAVITKEAKREIKIYDDIEEFDKNLPSTVTLLDTPFGSKVYLVGTAHFSEDSQDDVSLVIRNVRPDVVMVELCPSRIHILKLDERTLLEEAKNFNIAKIRSIIQAHGYINGIFFILLLQMSAQIAKDLGMAPGGEFRRAFEEVHKLPGCLLHLGDRPIRVTLHRALRALSLWQTMKLVWRLTSTDTISIEEVEECKQRDLLEKLMEEMAGEFPAFSDVFVHERDIFLCHSLQMAALPHAPNDGSNKLRPVRVVGIVGIGHATGIAKLWGNVDPQLIPAIMEIPPPSRSTRIFQYTVKYGLICITLYGAFKILRPRLTRFL